MVTIRLSYVHVLVEYSHSTGQTRTGLKLMQLTPVPTHLDNASRFLYEPQGVQPLEQRVAVQPPMSIYRPVSEIITDHYVHHFTNCLSVN